MSSDNDSGCSDDNLLLGQAVAKKSFAEQNDNKTSSQNVDKSLEADPPTSCNLPDAYPPPPGHHDAAPQDSGTGRNRSRSQRSTRRQGADAGGRLQRTQSNEVSSIVPIDPAAFAPRVSVRARTTTRPLSLPTVMTRARAAATQRQDPGCTVVSGPAVLPIVNGPGQTSQVSTRRVLSPDPHPDSPNRAPAARPLRLDTLSPSDIPPPSQSQPSPPAVKSEELSVAVTAARKRARDPQPSQHSQHSQQADTTAEERRPKRRAAAQAHAVLKNLRARSSSPSPPHQTNVHPRPDLKRHFPLDDKTPDKQRRVTSNRGEEDAADAAAAGRGSHQRSHGRGGVGGPAAAARTHSGAGAFQDEDDWYPSVADAEVTAEDAAVDAALPTPAAGAAPHARRAPRLGGSRGLGRQGSASARHKAAATAPALPPPRLQVTVPGSELKEDEAKQLVKLLEDYLGSMAAPSAEAIAKDGSVVAVAQAMQTNSSHIVVLKALEAATLTGLRGFKSTLKPLLAALPPNVDTQVRTTHRGEFAECLITLKATWLGDSKQVREEAVEDWKTFNKKLKGHQSGTSVDPKDIMYEYSQDHVDKIQADAARSQQKAVEAVRAELETAKAEAASQRAALESRVEELEATLAQREHASQAAVAAKLTFPALEAVKHTVPESAVGTSVPESGATTADAVDERNAAMAILAQCLAPDWQLAMRARALEESVFMLHKDDLNQPGSQYRSRVAKLTTELCPEFFPGREGGPTPEAMMRPGFDLYESVDAKAVRGAKVLRGALWSETVPYRSVAARDLTAELLKRNS